MAAPSFHFPRVEHAALSSRRRSDSLAICVRLKNEALYLREWIEFHRIAGVGHFHIFDDGSTDGTIEVLRPYVEHGIVTLQVGSRISNACVPGFLSSLLIHLPHTIKCLQSATLRIRYPWFCRKALTIAMTPNTARMATEICAWRKTHPTPLG